MTSTDEQDQTTDLGEDDMTTLDEASSTLCHDLLLSVAGRAPDDLVTTARGWLEEGRHLDVARALMFAALAHRVPLDQDALLGLADLLALNEVDHAPLRQAEIAVGEVPTPFVFGTSRDRDADRAADRDRDGDQDDPRFDPAAAEVVADEGFGARGVWRAWRHPADGSPWPAPRLVHLVEVSSVSQRHHLAAALGRALADSGEAEPQVECYATGEHLGAYQRGVRSGGELVWAASADSPVEVAQLFDHVDDDGVPSFADDRARVADQDERDRLCAYLDQGAALLMTTALGDDVIDPERGDVVPMSFRTDGSWIWSDALTYYLREHGVRPQDGLMSHLDQVAGSTPVVDGVDLHRAAAALSL